MSPCRPHFGHPVLQSSHFFIKSMASGCLREHGPHQSRWRVSSPWRPQFGCTFLQSSHFLFKLTASGCFCAHGRHQRGRGLSGLPQCGLFRLQSSHFLFRSTASACLRAHWAHQRRVRRASPCRPQFGRMFLQSSHLGAKLKAPGCFLAHSVHQTLRLSSPLRAQLGARRWHVSQTTVQCPPGRRRYHDPFLVCLISHAYQHPET